MSKMEQVYYGALVHWYRHRSVPPSMLDLANLCRPARTKSAIRAALISLEYKGYVRRDTNGQFRMMP